MPRYLDENHVVPVLAPVDTAGVAIQTDVVGLKEYHQVRFILQFGVITGDSAVVTVEECDDTTPSNSTAIAFSGTLTSAVGTDLLGTRTATAATGWTIEATDDGKALIIDVDAAQLSAGYPYIRVVVTPGGSMTVCLLNAVAILRPRYAQAVPPSAVD